LPANPPLLSSDAERRRVRSANQGGKDHPERNRIAEEKKGSALKEMRAEMANSENRIA
jgi:hypothetical protein